MTANGLCKHRIKHSAIWCIGGVIGRFLKLIIMIEYFDRYSSTNEPDKMGRWARTAVYKNIRIAWISRVETKDKVVFSVSCNFPTMQNDTANEHKVCFSLDEAKDFVKERWVWFLKSVT